MVKQRSRRTEKAGSMEKQDVAQVAKANASIKHGHSLDYTLDEVKEMEPQQLVLCFSSNETIENGDKKNALKCHMLGTKCSQLITGRTSKECKTAMELHLARHIKNYTAKLSRNPKFYSKMRFTSYSGVGLVQSEEMKPSDILSVRLFGLDKNDQKNGEKRISLTPNSKQSLLNTLQRKSGSNSPVFSLNASKLDNIFTIMSRELLPSVVIDKIDMTPEKKRNPYSHIHDPYECQCINKGDDICCGKAALLSALCLERIRLQPDDSAEDVDRSAKVDQGVPRLIQTRLQRKKAILDRMYRKHQAAIAPSRLRKRLASLTSANPKNKAKSISPHKQRIKRLRSPRNRLLVKLKQTSRTTMKRDGTLLGMKGYNLRKAKLMKKASSNLLGKSKAAPPKGHATPSPTEAVYNPIGEVVRMPIEEMLELMEQEEKLAGNPPCFENPTPSKLLPPPLSADVSFEQDTDILQGARCSDTLIRAKVPAKQMERIEVKEEPLSDEEQSITPQFLTTTTSHEKDEEKLGKKGQKMTVSRLLFQRRKNASKPMDKGFGCDFLFSSSGESADGCELSDSDEDGSREYSGGDRADADEEETGVTSTSDEDFEDEATRLPPPQMLPADRIKKIKKEVEDVPVPALTQQELSLVGLFNDHTYSAKELDYIRRMDNILSRIHKMNEEDEAHQPPVALTDDEMKIREQALTLLRHIRYRDRTRRELSTRGMQVETFRDELVCKICAKRFTASNSLYYHYRSHAGVKPYKCDVCQKTFTRLHSLNYHMMIHDNMTRFKCKYCNRGFRHPSHFKEHLNKHTGEEPYQCSECGRRFKTSNTHRRHMLVKHQMRANKKRARRVLPYALRTTRYVGEEEPNSSTGGNAMRGMLSHSPPLPDSPPPPRLPLRPFAFPQPKPVKLVLFPKNGIYRLSYTAN